MRVQRLKVGIGILCIAALATPAFGQTYDYEWVHPCGPDGGALTCDPHAWPPICWCTGTWDDSDHWDGDTYPDESTDTALIEHSNAYLYCDGGPRDGNRCSTDSDCYACVGGDNDGDSCTSDEDCPAGTCNKSGTCDDSEAYTYIEITTETIDDLDIQCESTSYPTDSLDLRLVNKTPGSKTLAVDVLTIESTNGPVTVGVLASATLEAESISLDATNGIVTLTVGGSAEVTTDTD